MTFTLESGPALCSPDSVVLGLARVTDANGLLTVRAFPGDYFVTVRSDHLLHQGSASVPLRSGTVYEAHLR